MTKLAMPAIVAKNIALTTPLPTGMKAMTAGSALTVKAVTSAKDLVIETGQMAVSLTLITGDIMQKISITVTDPAPIMALLIPSEIAMAVMVAKGIYNTGIMVREAEEAILAVAGGVLNRMASLGTTLMGVDMETVLEVAVLT